MLRKFKAETDSDLIVAGEVEAFSKSFPHSPMPPSMVTSRILSIQKGQYSCKVLDEDGPKGYVVYSKELQKNNIRIYIVSIYIDPSIRGKGKLEAILDSLREISTSCTIELDVSLSNQSAVAAYEAIGFETQRLRMSKIYPPDGKV